MIEYYKLHVCRLDNWPQCLNRSFEKINYELYKYMWGPSEFTVTGSLKNFERVDQLKEITIPVLFTCGTHDETTPTTIKYYQSHLPGSGIKIFEGASHEHHIEHSVEYLQTARTFFRNAEKLYVSRI